MFSGLDFFTGVDFEDTLAFVAACGGGGADQDRAEEKDGLELHGEVVAGPPPKRRVASGSSSSGSVGKETIVIVLLKE